MRIPARVRWRPISLLAACAAFAQPASVPDPLLPNVLLIGDSVSLDYTSHVRSLLRGKANILRPVDSKTGQPINCGSTQEGLRGIEEWLALTRWDVIHFNWGLWDLCYRNPESKLYGNRDKIKGRISVPLAQYREHLETLVRRLEKTGARLIWANTTVIPAGEAGRFVGDEIQYNQAAAEIMFKHGIAIDDLYALTRGFPSELFVAPGDVHYSKKGSSILAAQVARAIQAALSRQARSALMFFGPLLLVCLGAVRLGAQSAEISGLRTRRERRRYSKCCRHFEEPVHRCKARHTIQCQWAVLPSRYPCRRIHDRRYGNGFSAAKPGGYHGGRRRADPRGFPSYGRRPETVTVAASQEPINSTCGETGTTVSPALVMEMALPDRNECRLVNMVPGAYGTGCAAGTGREPGVGRQQHLDGINNTRGGGVLNAVVGGWEYSTIATFQSGTPFGATVVNCGLNFLGDSAVTLRPDLVGTRIWQTVSKVSLRRECADLSGSIRTPLPLRPNMLSPIRPAPFRVSTRRGSSIRFDAGKELHLGVSVGTLNSAGRRFAA